MSTEARWHRAQLDGSGDWKIGRGRSSNTFAAEDASAPTGAGDGSGTPGVGGTTVSDGAGALWHPVNSAASTTATRAAVGGSWGLIAAPGRVVPGYTCAARPPYRLGFWPRGASSFGGTVSPFVSRRAV